jgi:proline utilization trans-activator
MDGEHAFSAAIILVMVNIAFPYNARDRASMNMALDVLSGIADKGNSHIKSLHRLLLSLYPMTRLEYSDESMIQKQAPEAPALLPDPFAAFLAQIDGGNANAGIFSTVDSNLFEEVGVGDERIWEEGFEFFDVNMDFDWTQWNNGAKIHD